MHRATELVSIKAGFVPGGMELSRAAAVEVGGVAAQSS